MSIQVALHHVTRYRYDRPVTLSPQVVRLRPAPHCRTPITGYSLKIQPSSHFINWQQDPFGNYEARLVFPKVAAELVVEVDLVADMTVINPFDFFLDEYAEKFPFAYPELLRHDLTPYLELAETGPLFSDFVERVRGEFARPERRTIDVLVDVNRRVNERLRYDIRMEPGVFPPEETLARGHGSCRDFAWLLVQVLRSLGLAARFVSGYSIQLVADEKPLTGPAGVSKDVTDLHAWAEVFLPGAGWIGLDATSGLLTGEGHIPLACTPSFTTAAPISGSFAWESESDDEEIGQEFSFEMSVCRLAETPRVTLPYTEEAWQKIDALGHQVDQALEAGDVRLTMGGEPTFVAADDPQGDEWSTAAVGPNKRRYASDLVRRLLARFAPGGLLHEGQGKWYPGEQLPRWALSVYFRKDRTPIWTDPARFAPEHQGRETADSARAFTTALAERLGVDPAHTIPGFEDVWYYLWRERRLPTNVDPLDAKLDDPVERERIARVFGQGLGSAVGYALPLRRCPDGQRTWETGDWFLRREHMFLLPGDSPMGYRLPLDSLAWVPPGQYPHIYELDPFAPTGALPSRDELVRRRQGQRGPVEPVPFDPTRGALGAGRGETDAARRARREQDDEASRTNSGAGSAAGVVRTAVCVEPRGGILHVFMPPVQVLEDYLDLCAAIEETAASLDKQVRLEGYHPPSDPRLEKLSVTPDPGVIEVNIHPAANWTELRENTTTLYELAKESHLRAEKFMVDGRHSGTGGGNHVVLGGPSPADSPLLRRPDLLRSLLGYWLNHPSLSYLFSGLFVGPTSQAPRVDEARHDSVDELEIAFRAIDRLGDGPVPPWLVDRSLRHMLVDVSGNTHRAEFCIDKLYSPDGPAGRLGLLELRSFEMPPHAKMSLTQQLLVRALVASFWKTPYREPTVRWGTQLQDRFALPHFVWADFEDVVRDLARSGFTFDPAWFAPHWEFRFPTFGTVQTRPGVVLEVRQALEPWPVLGEEPGASTTARFVDSSVERVQAKVSGIHDDRYMLACNGVRVPLHPTGTNGEYVAGIRYRAWQPPSSLHPMIAPHSPLVFDLYDRWSRRAVCGCTYHVAHAGGRAHDLFPVNSFEAESRRVARFTPFGHTPGAFDPREPDPNPRFPYTLDLRR